MTTVVPLISGEPPEDLLFEQIACDLEQRGLVILPNALPAGIADSLLVHLADLDEAAFHRAGVGRRGDHAVNAFVRRDVIHWIDETQERVSDWIAWTDRLQTYLNRRLFLGLVSFESHYAVYGPGDFYKRHLDAFQGESNRVLSLVTYLNKGWEPDQGGELLIHAIDGEAIKVSPAFGTLVIFLSEEFPHEVLPATRERYSVAGWFRLNTSIMQEIDPPR